jgi:hypothetical protein
MRRLEAGQAGINSRQRQKIYFSYHDQICSAARPASYPMGTEDSSLRIKWTGRDPDHSLPFCAEVKNGAIPPLPHMFMA